MKGAKNPIGCPWPSPPHWEAPAPRNQAFLSPQAVFYRSKCEMYEIHGILKVKQATKRSNKLTTNHDYLRVSVSSTPTAQWSSLWNPKVFLRPSCWRRLPSARHFSRSFACWDLSPKGSNIYSTTLTTLLFEWLKFGVRLRNFWV